MPRPRADADPHPNVSMREILSRHGARWNRPEVREICDSRRLYTTNDTILQPEYEYREERNRGGNKAVRRIILKACLQPLKDSIPDEIKKPYRHMKKSCRKLMSFERRGSTSLGRSLYDLAIMNPNNPVDMVRAEMTFYADMFNKMTELCFKKCVPRFHETELSTGELVCADRCVAKYVDATNKVGEIMQAAQMAQMGATPPQ